MPREARRKQVMNIEQLLAIQNEVMVKVVAVDAKVDTINAKVDIIMEEVKALKYNNMVQEPSVPTRNPGQTSHQYNQAADTRPVKYTNAKGQAIFDVCADCGYEITSPRVGAYCDSNDAIPGVFCPKCQKKHGYDAASLGLSKTGRTVQAKEKPVNKPAPKGLPVSCAICKGVMYFDSKEAIAGAYERAIKAGFTGVVHKKCAKDHVHTESEDMEISVPSVDAKIQDTRLEHEYRNQVDSTKFEAETRKDKATMNAVADIVGFLLDRGCTGDDIKAMPIAEARKLMLGYDVVVDIHGNVWNKTKASVVDMLVKDVPVANEEVEDDEFSAAGYEEDNTSFGNGSQDF